MANKSAQPLIKLKMAIAAKQLASIAYPVNTGFGESGKVEDLSL
jgi:hypothetical protein